MLNNSFVYNCSHSVVISCNKINVMKEHCSYLKRPWFVRFLVLILTYFNLVAIGHFDQIQHKLLLTLSANFAQYTFTNF